MIRMDVRLSRLSLAIFCLLFMSQVLLAHRPVIVKDQSSKDKPVLVEKPEISYAYYGLLNGEPHYYRIDSPAPFHLYVNILVPDYSPKTEAIPFHDISFQVYKDDSLLHASEGIHSTWKRFYEKYGRDHYYMGPEFEQKVEAGIYYIKVYNTENTGKYALAIGKKEKFTIFTLIGALFKARSLDRWFFKENPKR